MTVHLPLDPTSAYGAVAGRDARWDGRLYLGVVTTGIYCRPSCPARTPRPENCQYFPTAAAAVAAGFRACRRCRPDSLPGSRHWDARGDLVSRAVQLISGGALDDGGVPGLARRLAVSERHLTRMLVAEVGAGPLALGRTRRAHTARLLIEQTTMPLADVAFAAGFGSIRQFNDVMRAEFGCAPRTFRRPQAEAGSGRSPSCRAVGAAVDPGDRVGVGPASLVLRLAYRPPLALAPLRRTLTAHAVAGVEAVVGTAHWRVVDAPGGPAVVRLSLTGGDDAPDAPDTPGTPDAAAHHARDLPHHLTVTVRPADLADLMLVVARVRRWLDLDADPVQVGEHLRDAPLVGDLVARRQGLRVPGVPDGAELAVCAVLGQQVSLAVARTFQGRIARAFGTPVTGGGPADVAAERAAQGAASEHAQALDGERPPTDLVTFPRASVLAEAGPQAIRDAANLTQARARAVHAVATALADGLTLEPGVDVAATRSALLALPGIGPWTTDYLTLRALRDPDAFMPSDLVLRKALAARTGVELGKVTSAVAEGLSAPWRPWRSYALQHLWTAEVYA